MMNLIFIIINTVLHRNKNNDKNNNIISNYNDSNNKMEEIINLHRL